MMADSEFCVVSRRKAARRAKKQPLVDPVHDDTHCDVGLFKKKLDNAKQDLITDGLWVDMEQVLKQAAQSMIDQDIPKISCRPYSGNDEMGGLQSLCKTSHGNCDSKKEYPWTEIVCYGLGNFSSCPTARWQLSLLLLLIECVKPERCLVYDPVFSELEKEILGGLDMQMIDNNEEGKRVAGVKTLYYMPHCGKALYNNLLWANWGECLKNIVVIGNSFKAMEENLLERVFKEKYMYIQELLPYTCEFRIPHGTKYSDVFNDTSVHVFQHVATMKSWSQRKEPSYDSTDVEIIVNTKACK